MKFVVEFTEEEGTALLQLLDQAVKAQGLAVAGNAAVLGRKVQEAHQAAKLEVISPKVISDQSLKSSNQ